MLKVAIMGFGNVASYAAESIIEASDMELVGIAVRDVNKVRKSKLVPEGVPLVNVGSWEELGKVDVMVLGIASRAIETVAPTILKKGVCTVDSYDIHGERLMELRKNLDAAGKEGGSAAIISAGWDPGTDSITRAMFEILAPVGITHTNFGPGMSMGHTVAVKSYEGVKDALSLTLPKGYGLHKRYIYIETAPGHSFDDIVKAVSADPYFCHDECHFFESNNIDALLDMGHGVLMERCGSTGKTHNQRLTLTMTLDNPAATAQVMVASARAVAKQRPGCYTMLEVPMVDFLEGEKNALLKRLI